MIGAIIGDVVGYELKDGQKIAIPGRLVYRGYNVEDLIKDAEKNKQFGYEQCAYLLLSRLSKVFLNFSWNNNWR